MEGLKFQELGFGEKAKARALSAALTFAKKLKKVGGPLGYGAEFLHPPASRDFNWNESFYFNFTDPSSKLGGWTRIGILPNQENDVGALMIYAGGSRILAYRSGGRTAIQGDELRLESLEYHRLEPLKKWRILFRGDVADIDDSMKIPELSPDDLELKKVEVDLTFESMAPCFDFKNAHPRALAEMIVQAGTRLEDLRQVAKVSSEHYEQAGRITGTIKIEDEIIPFDGSGHRDHSWGLRDWAAPRLWTWLSCQFGDELSFNLSRVAIASVDILNGYISRDGSNYALRRAALETEFEDDGITQKWLRFQMEDSGGKTIEITGDVMTVAPLQLESEGHWTQVNEALTEYHYGNKVGYGIAEYLHQLGSRT